jgi:hypothetical protein
MIGDVSIKVYPLISIKKGAVKHPLGHLSLGNRAYVQAYFIDFGCAYLRSHLEAIAPMAAPTSGLLKNLRIAG